MIEKPYIEVVNKGYREVRASDKLPSLPSTIKPIYISKRMKHGRIYIFGEDDDQLYTFVWDKISAYPETVYYKPKHK